MSRYRTIAQTLLELTRVRPAEVARMAEVNRSNLAKWLAGQDSALAADKQLSVCAALGWRMGSLRRDRVWRVCIEADWTPLHRMLTVLDNAGAFSSVDVFPTEGRLLAHGAVILARRVGEPVPLVILLSRPLADHPWLPPSAEVIPRARMGGIHAVSEREWTLWWHGKAPRGEVTDYLMEFGQEMMEQVCRDEVLQAPLFDEADHDGSVVPSSRSGALTFPALSGDPTGEWQRWQETLAHVSTRTGLGLEQLREIFLRSVRVNPPDDK
ncbi:hypothetical protein KSF73_16725 [Burkholderiaceae bacterium DAT-1]|nr:hypothetical protein [Burkholderiaceae bacterium DAT-1]